MSKYQGCDGCNLIPCGKTKLAKKYCPYRLHRMRAYSPMMPRAEDPAKWVDCESEENDEQIDVDCGCSAHNDRNLPDV